MTQHIEEARKLADRVVGLWITRRPPNDAATVIAAALAAAEERGRIAALEEAATRIDRQWRTTGAINCTEICAIVLAVATKEPTP